VRELGGRIARQIARLTNGNVLYHRRHAQFMNRDGQGSGGYRLFGFLEV